MSSFGFNGANLLDVLSLWSMPEIEVGRYQQRDGVLVRTWIDSSRECVCFFNLKFKNFEVLKNVSRKKWED